jgi:MFS family permease
VAARAEADSRAVATFLQSRLFQLLLLALAVWAGGYARVALGPLQESMRNALALSDNQIALLQGPALALAVMTGSVPLGLLVDRCSRVRLLLIFVLLGLAGSVVTALATHFIALFFARALVGLAAIASLIAAFSAMADLYAPAQRGRAAMVIGTITELSPAASFALGGALLVVYGVGGEGWRWALLWTTAPPLLLIMLMMLALREPRRTDVIVSNPPVRAAMVELWRFRAMIGPLLAARVMVWVADGATLIWVTPHLMRRFHLLPDRAGTIMAVVLLVAGLGGPLAGGLLADLCHRAGGPRRTMQVLGWVALLSIPLSLFALAPGVLSTSVLLGAFVLAGFMTNTAAAALSTIVIPNELRGTYLSMTMVVGALFGLALAPLLVSSLSGVLGGPAAVGKALAIVCVISSVLAAAIFVRGSRHFPAQTRHDLRSTTQGMG